MLPPRPAPFFLLPCLTLPGLACIADTLNPLYLYDYGLGDAWAGCNAGYILSFIPGRKVLHENAENDKRSNSNKRVFFFFQIYMVNLLHDFVVYVYLCLVRHNLLFRRSREDLLDLQRGRIQKFLFDTGLRGMSGSNLKSRFWAIYKLILLPLKSKLAVNKHSSPVTLLTCNHVPVSRKSRKLFGPRKMFCACVCIQIKIKVSKGPLGPV